MEDVSGECWLEDFSGREERGDEGLVMEVEKVGGLLSCLLKPWSRCRMLDIAGFDIMISETCSRSELVRTHGSIAVSEPFWQVFGMSLLMRIVNSHGVGRMIVMTVSRACKGFRNEPF